MLAATAILAGLVSLAAPYLADGDAITGPWEGAFSLRGSDWPARLDIRADDDADSVSATLDLPQLGMIAEPVEARRAEQGGVIVAVPFGLGEYELTAVADADGDTLSARALADSGIALTLARAAAHPYATREVSFETADGLSLPGTLYRPNTPGPHAAVVMLHGAQPQGRDHWGYRSWAHHYASLGLAALVYDKRPQDAGRDLAALTNDARAAHAWLRAQTGIDAERVGFAGGSQAGWLGARIATDPEAQVAFLVLSGVPAVTPREQEIQSLRNGMRDDGIAAEHVEAAVAYTNLMMYVARTGRLWEEFQPLIAEAAEAEPWGQYVNQPRSLDDLAWWSRNLDFGGEQDWSRVRCPVLALWGEADWVVPPHENEGRLRRALRRAGNDDVTTRVVPEADHRGEVGFRNEDGVVRWPRLAPGWHDTIDAWLRERGFTTSR